ncbi:MAG TPA: hypothetical protein ENH82_11815 [bacterium]|nr:hypothetical protein [bacterium]
MTLLELAKQYESDVMTRLDCIQLKCDAGIAEADSVCVADWEATLEAIRKTIKEAGKDGELIVAAILNELEHGYGVTELESYGRPTCQGVGRLVFGKQKLEHTIIMVHDGELAFCTTCKGGEGSLTTECCGRPMTSDEEHRVYRLGTLDFIDGKWEEIK